VTGEWNRHFGKEIIASETGAESDDAKVQTLWLKMYKVSFPHTALRLIWLIPGAQEFIEAIDGIDNGISQYSSPDPAKYRSRTDLSSRVGWLNPAWNEPADAEAIDVRASIRTI
jgi:hypothetical protein